MKGLVDFSEAVIEGALRPYLPGTAPVDTSSPSSSA
jgi:hypothetical protein